MVRYLPCESPHGVANIEGEGNCNLTLDPLSVTGRKSVTQTFTGAMTDLVTAAGIAGRTIIFVVDGTDAETAVTGADGKYSLIHTFTAGSDKQYGFWARFAGDP